MNFDAEFAQLETLTVERQMLVGKKFDAGLTDEEEIRFEQINNEIDDLEMNLYAEDFERLESLLFKRQKLAQQLDLFCQEVNAIAGRQ